ncbi:hypothetical protein [Ammoniphilus sp. CFH 90114]|uniref:hypothetical protein n=1 Tax=Ammoniphilus sp. CFH 90114 TaxID=2493665 RepID=UPI00100E4BA6|nr:hypothetical protein [Ammoniphilus sp. CFH 90114]RXT13759.1 hypothetical protein EIZ39_06345 [Ammoniphilus sp. CFH 90114]
MIGHGFSEYQELTLEHLRVEDILHMGQWIHVYVSFKLDSIPQGLSDPSALVILNDEKEVVQMVVLDEGCDSEYKLTEVEQKQISTFLQEQKVLENLSCKDGF